MSDNTHRFDLIIIGGGLCGVTFLKYAWGLKVRCIVLDKQQEGVAQPAIHHYVYD